MKIHSHFLRLVGILHYLCHLNSDINYSNINMEEKNQKNHLWEGVIKERMHAARTNYREGIDHRLRELETEVSALNKEVQTLRKELKR